MVLIAGLWKDNHALLYQQPCQGNLGCAYAMTLGNWLQLAVPASFPSLRGE